MVAKMSIGRAVSAFFNLMFGCLHSNYSFPHTPRGKQPYPAANLTGMYVVCLSCGKEFPYDWNEMKVISHPPAEPMSAPESETFPSSEPLKSFANKAA